MTAEPAALSTRLREAADAFLILEPAVPAGAPWSPAVEFGHRPEAAWGPPEVLAHVTEMLPYWLGEVERILAGSPAPVPFGRVATDEVRIAIIGRDRTVPPRELFDRVGADVLRYAHRLEELTAADLARQGLHPVRGVMSVEEILERFVVAHLAEHAAQLGELLGSPSPAA